MPGSISDHFGKEKVPAEVFPWHKDADRNSPVTESDSILSVLRVGELLLLSVRHVIEGGFDRRGTRSEASPSHIEKGDPQIRSLASTQSDGTFADDDLQCRMNDTTDEMPSFG